MKTVYRCEKCGKEFEEWDKCYEHEKSHVTPIYAQPFALDENGYAYKPNIPYPDMLAVEMSNGAIILYLYQCKIATKSSDRQEAV